MLSKGSMQVQDAIGELGIDGRYVYVSGRRKVRENVP